MCVLTELTKAELDLFLTPHDLNRLDKYAQNMVDYHMVMDLLPTLARLYFTRRLDVSLNELKSVCFVFITSVLLLVYQKSFKPLMYSVSQKNPPCGLVTIFPKQLGISQPNFTRVLCVPMYARLRIFIQLSATLTKLCHIKRDHPVHIMCAKCPPLAEMHAGIF